MLLLFKVLSEGRGNDDTVGWTSRNGKMRGCGRRFKGPRLVAYGECLLSAV